MRRDLVHAATVGVAFTLLFLWVFAQPIVYGTYLSATDLFDYYLPSFLSPPLVWSSYEYAGTPVFADPEGSLYYPLRRFFADVLGSWTGFLVAGHVLAACTLYAYVHHLTRSVVAGAIAGLTFALSEAMMERLPHPTIVHAVAWVPLVLLAIDRVCHARHRWLWAAIGGFATGNCLLAGHPQLPLYAGYLCAVYATCNLLRHRSDWRTWASMGIIPSAGVMLAAVSLLPLLGVSAEAERQTVSLDSFVSYANSVPQMLSIAFPRVSHPGLESPTYVGLGVLILAPLGMVQFRQNWRATFWTAVVALALLLGVGAATPLGELARSVPFYERFRIVSRHLVFAAIGFSVLAGFAVARIQQGNVRLRMLLWSSAPAIALVITGAIAIVRLPDLLPLDPPAAAALLSGGNWGGVAGPILVALCSVLGCAAFWRYPHSSVAAAVLLTVLAADLLIALPWAVTSQGVAFEAMPREAIEPSVHVERLKSQLAGHQQRLLTPGGARGNEVVVGPWARRWQIPLAQGYSSVQLRRISNLMPPPRTGRLDSRNLQSKNMVLDLLAVRFLLVAAGGQDESILRGDAERWHEVDRFSTSLVSDRQVDAHAPGETAYVVFENSRAQPRAWMTRELLPVTDGMLEDAILTSHIGDRLVDPTQTALVDEEGLQARTYGPGPQSAVVESIADGVIRVRVSSAAGGFLVLSEAFYPGWQGRIDAGPLQPVKRTYLALQGIDVPAGDHLVTFEFVSRSRQAGLAFSAAGSMLIAACGVVSLRRS